MTLKITMLLIVLATSAMVNQLVAQAAPAPTADFAATDSASSTSTTTTDIDTLAAVVYHATYYATASEPPNVPMAVTSPYAFGNPAGCATSTPGSLTADQMLANVQAALGDAYNLAERRQSYIWNGPLGTLMDVSQDPYVYEFTFNDFQHPLTYRADPVVTVFLNNGFIVWLRAYGGNFRLTAIPMIKGVLTSNWAEYATSYWQLDGGPNDTYIYPVIKKLPCHWIVDAGYVSNATLRSMFDFNWNIPAYLSAGRQYLADTCKEAHRVSQEEIGYWDATSMCGPLAWTIMHDVNGFPYRIGSWSMDAGAFTAANPKWNGQPWSTFDPETFDLTHTELSMPRYDFEKYGNLYPGDLIYSYSGLYEVQGDLNFDHIFVVAGIDSMGARLTVSNMVRSSPHDDCSIEEVTLYTPGNRETGVINHEWNGFGYGTTGTSGFDIFRWKWITYHINGLPQQYTVRWGDTLETIAFDWKVSPESLAAASNLPGDAQLQPGQVITLPLPEPFSPAQNVITTLGN